MKKSNRQNLLPSGAGRAAEAAIVKITTAARLLKQNGVTLVAIKLVYEAAIMVE